VNQVAPAEYEAFAENVLIQARTPDAMFSTDPAMRQTASAVAAALAVQPKDAIDIRTPLSAGGQSLVSKDGSALVTFNVPGNVADVDTAAVADQHAVALLRP
jgi:hypothetical protein